MFLAIIFACLLLRWVSANILNFFVRPIPPDAQFGLPSVVVLFLFAQATLHFQQIFELFREIGASDMLKQLQECSDKLPD